MPRIPDNDENKPPDNLDERLNRLRTKLNQVDNSRTSTDFSENSPENSGNKAGIAQGLRLSSEFIAGVVVGAGIGYLIDAFFGTSPFGLIIFLMLGFAAAVLNVMRAAGVVAESELHLKAVREMPKRQEDDTTDKGSQK